MPAGPVACRERESRSSSDSLSLQAPPAAVQYSKETVSSLARFTPRSIRLTGTLLLKRAGKYTRADAVAVADGHAANARSAR